MQGGSLLIVQDTDKTGFAPKAGCNGRPPVSAMPRSYSA